MPDYRTHGTQGRFNYGAKALVAPNPYGATPFPPGYGGRGDEEEEGSGFVSGPFDCPVCGKVCSCRIARAGHMRSHKK